MTRWSSYARGRPKIKGRKNKTELAYENEVLKPLQLAGEIVDYWYEPVTFRLAEKTTYTPDFMVLLPSMETHFHEVKGTWKDKETKQEKAHWEPDSRAKFKTAAELYPYLFVGVAKIEGEWKREEI